MNTQIQALINRIATQPQINDAVLVDCPICPHKRHWYVVTAVCRYHIEIDYVDLTYPRHTHSYTARYTEEWPEFVKRGNGWKNGSGTIHADTL